VSEVNVTKLFLVQHATTTECDKGKGKGRARDIAPQVTNLRGAQVHGARTKQRRTYLPYTFPAVAGTHLPTPRGWRVEYAQAQGAKSN